MIEDYKIITITHKSAALKDIGHFVLDESGDISLTDQLEILKEELSIPELIYLPTCNRVLFFFSSENTLDDSFLNQFTEILYPDWGTNLDVFITHEGEDAIRHLFEVAASVDSLVVGEREIIRQLRQSYERCRKEQLTGDSLRLAMDATVKTAKRVYANTRIGEKQVSIVSLAIKKLLESHISKDDRILVVGAGQTNALVGKFLKKYEFSNIAIFNRTLPKAEELAHFTGGKAYALDSLKNYKAGFDCMIVCTGSTEPIITSDLYESLLIGEEDKKVVIDLAIPNNVDHPVPEQFVMDYIEIDGLKLLAKENLAFRAQEVFKAKDIIEQEICEYHTLYKERQIERAFSSMPTQIKEIKSRAMNEVFAKEMDHLDEETKDLLERMMTYMEKKCISIPMKVAKETILPS